MKNLSIVVIGILSNKTAALSTCGMSTKELDKNNLDLFLQTISRADQSFFTFAEMPGFTLPDCTVHRANE